MKVERIILVSFLLLTVSFSVHAKAYISHKPSHIKPAPIKNITTYKKALVLVSSSFSTSQKEGGILSDLNPVNTPTNKSNKMYDFMDDGNTFINEFCRVYDRYPFMLHVGLIV